MKDIKVKEIKHNIKTLDKKADIDYYEKKASVNIKDKQPSKSKEEETSSSSSPDHQAVDKVVNREKKTAVESAYYARKYTKNKRVTLQVIKTKDFSSTGLSMSDKNHKMNPQAVKQKGIVTKVRTVSSKLRITNKNIKKNNYSHYMKKLGVRKKQKKMKEATQKTSSIFRKGASASGKSVKVAFKAIVKTVSSIQNLISMGGALILLVVITLFIGVFASLSLDSGIETSTLPLSAEVLEHTETIRKYAIENDIESFVPLIQAIMMQESGGKGDDPMQASECPHNTKYPQKPNGITDPDYSIQVGIHYLSDCFKSGKVKDPFNIDHISLAVQGYNYGEEYISWAVTNFGGYTKANAKVFADMKKAELGWTTYGNPEYVPHVMRYVGVAFRGGLEPNFNNVEAWQIKNPYAQVGVYGQCTWFAWGRFYEMYGYSPGFIGDGWKCVDQLLKAYPDKFKRSDTPKVGAVFSCIGRNHVGIVVGWDGTNITIQEGNLDGVTNTFAQAKKDWHTATYTLDRFISICKGVVFAVPKT